MEKAIETKNKENHKTNVKAMVLCALFAALIAVGAFIKIPLPNVPFTLQFLFTNLAGLLLGRKYGAISVIVYVAIGLAGIPIFTQGGGIAYVLNPTFGYLLGMIIGTFVCGEIVRRKGMKFSSALVAGFVNLFIVYFIGMVHLFLIKNLYLNDVMGLKTVLIYGALVFLPGDGLSCVLGAVIASRLKKSVL